MGFYDKKIKQLYESCPRLVILSINSIFSKNHSIDAMVHYLDKEQPSIAEESETFMDMLIELEDCKYHFEFQLLEDNMAIRMYEYSVKETIREIRQHTNQEELSDRYMIEIIMPPQAVIFLAGGNKKEQITVNLTLPDGKKTSYQLPCISASQTVESLIQKRLFILLPFQMVQLNHRMNHIANAKLETKRRIAHAIYDYRQNVKNGLEKILSDGIINDSEFEQLWIALSDLENYLEEKDHTVEQEVKSMGDKDYIPWSERIRSEGVNLGIQQGVQQGIQQGVQESILTLLSALGEIPPALIEQIQQEKDKTTLSTWLTLAAKSCSIEDFALQIKNK